MRSFSNETLNFFFRKFWVSYILDVARDVGDPELSEEKI